MGRDGGEKIGGGRVRLEGVGGRGMVVEGCVILPLSDLSQSSSGRSPPGCEDP